MDGPEESDADVRAAAAQSYFENETIPHPRLLEMEVALDKLRLRSTVDRLGRTMDARILLIAGASGSGKSFGLKQYAALCPRVSREDIGSGKHRIADLPERYREGIAFHDYWPVVYVEANKSERSRSFASNLYGALGYQPPARWSSSDFVRRLMTVVSEIGVEMIIVDEAHHLINHRREEITERDVDFIKSLSNQLKVQIVLAGVPRVLDLGDEMQMRRRKEPDFIIDPYRWSDPADRRVFNEVMVGFAQNMQLADPSGIAAPDVAKRIYVTSGGYVGLASKHLSQALFRAVCRGLSSIPMLLHAEVFHDFLPKKEGRPRRRREWNEEADTEISAEDRARNPFLCSDDSVHMMIDALESTDHATSAQAFGPGEGHDKSRRTKIRGKGRPPYNPLAKS